MKLLYHGLGLVGCGIRSGFACYLDLDSQGTILGIPWCFWIDLATRGNPLRPRERAFRRQIESSGMLKLNAMARTFQAGSENTALATKEHFGHRRYWTDGSKRSRTVCDDAGSSHGMSRDESV
jgi:hypothetical protein